MKISVYILLQSLLFSSISCCFSEAENGKFDAAHQHNTHNTTSRFQHARSGPEINRDTAREHLSTNSSKADFPCPDSAVIAPCNCTVDSDNKITIDCTLVESVDQLVEVFKQDFPVKELYMFEMSSNNEVDFFPNFMNGVTFENIYLSPGDFILLAISDLFLIDLIDTLQDMRIFNSKLSTDFFPFYILPLMNQLDTLYISNSDITSIPPIISPALSTFAIEYSPIELLSNGTFPIGAGPVTLYLYGNQINTIELGSFFFVDQSSIDSNEQITIDLSSNQLQSLKAGTFPMRNGPMVFYLYLNQISSIEPGTFVFPTSTDMLSIFLYLQDNELTSVDERVFLDLMPFITEISLYDNPLTCGCDMAWLIVNSDFMEKVGDAATCADGTNLNDLDPQQFIDFC